MTLILDYSWARPDPAAIRAAGYAGVMRYLSPDASKDLTPGERDALFAEHLTIGLVWESGANRAAQGMVAGIADARTANAQADLLGYPATCPIFFAVDFAARPATVDPYFAGAAAASRRPVGVYGSATVIEGVSAAYRWQTSAWSGGVVSPHAHLYQRVTPTVPHPIASTDENVVLAALPMWGGALQVGSGAGVPLSTPTTTTIAPEDDMSAEDSQRIIELVDAVGRLEKIYGAADGRSRPGEFDDTHDKVLQIHNGVASLPTLLAANLGGPADPAAIAAEILKLGPQLAAEIAAHLTITVTPTP